jgi:hypothetical protein
MPIEGLADPWPDGGLVEVGGIDSGGGALLCGEVAPDLEPTCEAPSRRRRLL